MYIYIHIIYIIHYIYYICVYIIYICLCIYMYIFLYIFIRMACYSKINLTTNLYTSCIFSHDHFYCSSRYEQTSEWSIDRYRYKSLGLWPAFRCTYILCVCVCVHIHIYRYIDIYAYVCYVRILHTMSLLSEFSF